MAYNNIAVFAFPHVEAFGPMVVVRQGSSNDWAAYYAHGEKDLQSGGLVKLFANECERYGITAAIKAVYPNLTYRH